MTDLTITQGYVYISGSQANNATPRTASGTLTSGGDLVQINVQKVDEDIQSKITVDFQVPQTDGASTSNEPKTKFMKTWIQSFTVNGILENETGVSTREDKRDIITNFIKEGQNGKTYYLIIPKALTSGAMTATGVHQFPSGTRGIQGLIIKVKFTEDETDKQNNRYKIMFNFKAGTDL